MTAGNVPPAAPGSLKDEEYWAVVAYLVSANNLDASGKKLDPSTAKSITWKR